MRFCMTIVLGSIMLLFAHADAMAADLKLLFVSQDENSVERTIGEYLQSVHDINYTMPKSSKDPSDEWCKISISVDDAPDLVFYVDTMVSANDRESGQVSERCIKIQCIIEYGMKENNPNYSKALSITNEFMADVWVPHRVIFDNDGDLQMQSFINIPGLKYPVHPELVFDIMSRTVSSWKTIYKKLRAAGIERL